MDRATYNRLIEEAKAHGIPLNLPTVGKFCILCSEYFDAISKNELICPVCIEQQKDVAMLSNDTRIRQARNLKRIKPGNAFEYRICPTCGFSFGAKGKKIFCSRACYRIMQRLLEAGKKYKNKPPQEIKLPKKQDKAYKTLDCLSCGAAFGTHDERRKYCSKECYLEANRRLAKAASRKRARS